MPSCLFSENIATSNVNAVSAHTSTMLKTFGKEGKKEKKLAIDNEEFGEIGDAPPGDEAPRGRNKIYIEVKRIIDQKNKEYWSEDKVKKTFQDECF